MYEYPNSLTTFTIQKLPENDNSLALTQHIPLTEETRICNCHSLLKDAIETVIQNCYT